MACRPFTQQEKSELQFLYDEWAHPFFISRRDFISHMTDAGLQNCATEDWVDVTLPSWRQQFWRGVVDPIPWLLKPQIYLKNFRDAYCMEKMHQAFSKGLMEYGAALELLPAAWRNGFLDACMSSGCV